MLAALKVRTMLYSSILFLSVRLALCLPSPVNGPVVNEATARRLVRDAVVAVVRNPKTFDVELTREHLSGFYSFQAAFYNGNDPMHILYFAVNSSTGDVWDTARCKQITSPAIRREQKEISKRSNLSAQDQRSVREKSPGCTE
jgi:hypothetical protein